MKTKILTDSACDLPLNILERYQIKVLPYIVHIEGEQYKDGIDITPKEVSNAIRQGRNLHTSQVPQGLLYESFEYYASRRVNCLYVSLSSKFSGTYQTANMIANEISKQYPKTNITTIDSLAGSLAQGMIVQHAAELNKLGYEFNQIMDSIKNQINKFEHIFTIDDLKHLYRGGRIKLSSAWMGSILNIKPILHVQNGEILPLEKVRGTNKLLNRLVELVNLRGSNLTEQTIGIAHADDPKKANKLKELIQSRIACGQFMVNTISSVLSVHLGVGGVGVFFKDES